MISNINEYQEHLVADQLATGTIKTYIYEAKQLEKFLQDKNIDLTKIKTDKDKIRTKKIIIEYVEQIKGKYKNATVSNKIIAINKYLKFLGYEDLTVKNIKEQNSAKNEGMSQSDFNRIMNQARVKGTARDILMLELFYYTGIRVSEMSFFTVESLKNGYMLINNKGKYRQVPLVKQLVLSAKEYIKDQDIKTGAIILSREGKPIHRSTVFKRIKYLGGQARIKKSKAHPHSIRHLFAKNRLKVNNNNVLQLADLLGHESLDTTRRYTTLSVDEARQTINF